MMAKGKMNDTDLLCGRRPLRQRVTDASSRAGCLIVSPKSNGKIRR